MDGKVEEKVKNTTPQHWRNVKVWMAEARHGYPPSNVQIKNLEHINPGAFITVLQQVYVHWFTIGGSVLCPRLRVTHSWCGDCRGEYEEQQNLWVPWAPDRRVYKKVSGENDRKRLNTL